MPVGKFYEDQEECITAGNFRCMLLDENKRPNGDKFTDHFIDQMIFKAHVGSNSNVGYTEFLKIIVLA